MDLGSCEPDWNDKHLLAALTRRMGKQTPDKVRAFVSLLSLKKNVALVSRRRERKSCALLSKSIFSEPDFQTALEHIYFFAQGLINQRKNREVHHMGQVIFLSTLGICVIFTHEIQQYP